METNGEVSIEAYNAEMGAVPAEDALALVSDHDGCDHLDEGVLHMALAGLGAVEPPLQSAEWVVLTMHSSWCE
jgi:hypothetical protein